MRENNEEEMIKIMLVLFVAFFSFMMAPKAVAEPQTKAINQTQYCKDAGFERATWRVCAAYSVTTVKGDAFLVSSTSEQVTINCFYCVDKKGQMFPFVNPRGPDKFGTE